MKEELLAQLTQDEKLEVLAATIEGVAKDVALIKQVLVDAGADQPSVPRDIWTDAFDIASEPDGLDHPLTSFDGARLAEYLVFARSPLNGSRVYPDPRRIGLAGKIAYGQTDVDAPGARYLDLCAKWAVDHDVAIAAILAGLVDPYDTSFGARLERDVAMLAGTYKAETLPTGEILNRWVPRTLEDIYRRLMPSGSGGTASGNEG